MSGNNTGYIFGRNNVVEALKSDRQIDKIFVADGSGGSIGKIITIASDKHIPIIRINQSKLDNKFPGENHQGVVAVVAVKEYSTIDDILELAKERQEAPFIVIADEIADPHNLGAIIRSAECFGAHGVIISKRRAVGLTASVEKAAGGALNYLPVAKVVNLAAAVEDPPLLHRHITPLPHRFLIRGYRYPACKTDNYLQRLLLQVFRCELRWLVFPPYRTRCMRIRFPRLR